MSQSVENPLDSWHLDKRIPIALIFAIMVQTGAAVWWVATISSRVDMVERRATVLEANGTKTADTLAQSMNLLASINATQAAMQNSLNRIERNIDAGRAGPN